jgi:hypothetical protein
MRTRTSIARAGLLFVLALVAAACSGGDGGGPSPSVPTPGPTVSLPGLVIDVGQFIDCVEGGGIEVNVTEGPRFGATSEVQVSIPSEEGFTSVGVFVYDSADDATANKTSLDASLTGLGRPTSRQFANVLAAGLDELASDPNAQEALGTVVVCLGGSAGG